MDIAAYIKSSKTTPAQFARDLGCSRGHVNDIIKGRRKPGKKLALKLEALTGKPWWKWIGSA